MPDHEIWHQWVVSGLLHTCWCHLYELAMVWWDIEYCHCLPHQNSPCHLPLQLAPSDYTLVLAWLSPWHLPAQWSSGNGDWCHCRPDWSADCSWRTAQSPDSPQVQWDKCHRNGMAPTALTTGHRIQSRDCPLWSRCRRSSWGSLCNVLDTHIQCPHHSQHPGGCCWFLPDSSLHRLCCSCNNPWFLTHSWCRDVSVHRRRRCSRPLGRGSHSCQSKWCIDQ